ncbi:thiamine pyrophosphate-binding protein [Alphaproteobacteria bacterium]|nr:thiamine pyrophosphate-binding protein [Alphaproteobacteria bacterium]
MIIEKFIPNCIEAGIGLITSVPDGYLTPLIEQAEKSAINHVSAAREEECFGIASGAAMSGKAPLIMMQNSGFLNSIGCFATLCMNYGIPMVILVSHRGNLFDQNKYDTEKYRYFENFLQTANVFNVSWYQYKEEGNLIKMAYDRSLASREPSIISLDFAPTDKAAC